MNRTHRSGFGDELLDAHADDTVDRSFSGQAAVGADRVDGTPDVAVDGRGDAPPVDDQAGADDLAGSAMDGSGNDPLQFVHVGVVGGHDHDGSRVLERSGVDTVDGVGPGETDVVVSTSRQISGQGGEVQEDESTGDREQPPGTPHGADSTEWRLPRWSKIVLAVFALLVAAAMAFAVFEPIQVLPRYRVAPGYALTASDGTVVTSEHARGAVTLYSFAPLDCGTACDDLHATMREVAQRVPHEVDLGDVEFRLVTIAFDDAAEAEHLALAARSAAQGSDPWLWLGGSRAEIRAVVASGFRQFYEAPDDVTAEVRFDPGFVLVDGAGVIRGDYRYQTLRGDADKIVDHVSILGAELRYASGVGAVAYEAAHLFLCYP